MIFLLNKHCGFLVRKLLGYQMVQAQPSETSQVQKMEYTQLDSGDNPGCKISNRVLQYSQILKICSSFILN